ncbi:hypothetical protein V8G54_028126 [Vigna mungo]|uniref:Uncharacterized protein n=1 Tax=Vigna mungo TaxID=3915 RepID=A0AAQ3MRT0_VIGMU
MFCNLGQLLPKPSIIEVRSVLSFSWQENSKEISLNWGQLNTILDRECKSDSQSVERLDEQRTKPPRLEHPSILRLLRLFLSATNRPSSSPLIRMVAAPNVEISILSRLGHEKATQASIVESKSLSILRESLTIPGHFCNIEATNPTVTLTGTPSFNSSAALHIFFAVSLHPRHTFAADSNPAGGNLLITSHRRFAGRPHDSASRSRSGSVSENKSASILSSCSDGSNPEPLSSRSSNDRARRRLEEGCRRPDVAEEGMDTTERDESGGAGVMEADTGVLMVQL